MARIGRRYFLPFSASSSDNLIAPHSCQTRSISSTASLGSAWMDKIKGVFTGKRPSEESTPEVSTESFTLLKYADELQKARTVGSFKNFIVGRSSDATFKEAFKKQEDIIRYLGALDPTGQSIQTSQKQNAAKECNCTIAEVENALAKFTYAKEAMKKLEALKKEGKPMPKSWTELQKLVGSTPLDLARSNLAKSGQLSRNAMCPCGSKKKYKWCCGKNQA
ncbi:hypothetical protein H6P81_004313 [Aristolochia fimbriata]|uniref:Uncharacterized protein n=1 Tax=Aristolochia fimbriata TaxID=158543 RepID=A0AAV7FHE5_ARIFI|nr:hypothetical protein H6P81_004313 [Aristolochia fimbriata]